MAAPDRLAAIRQKIGLLTAKLSGPVPPMPRIRSRDGECCPPVPVNMNPMDERQASVESDLADLREAVRAFLQLLGDVGLDALEFFKLLDPAMKLRGDIQYEIENEIGCFIASAISDGSDFAATLFAHWCQVVPNPPLEYIAERVPREKRLPLFRRIRDIAISEGSDAWANRLSEALVRVSVAETEDLRIHYRILVKNHGAEVAGSWKDRQVRRLKRMGRDGDAASIEAVFEDNIWPWPSDTHGPQGVIAHQLSVVLIRPDSTVSKWLGKLDSKELDPNNSKKKFFKKTDVLQIVRKRGFIILKRPL